MSISSVTDSSTVSQTSTGSNDTARNVGEMGKDQFLKLLVTQLKYQDPMKPMEDKEFISQMAQFSSLEQMQNLNSNFSAMKAFSLMGKNIAATFQDSQTGEQTDVYGIVEKVKIEKGKVYVSVGEKDIPIDEITDISNQNVTKLTDLMPLIGKKVDGKIAEEEGGIIDIIGRVSSVKKSGGIDYAVMDEIQLNEVDVLLPDGIVEYKKDYMTRNIGKEVIVIATDSAGGKIHVKGILKEMTENGDKFDVKMGGVEVPIDNIRGIAQD